MVSGLTRITWVFAILVGFLISFTGIGLIIGIPLIIIGFIVLIELIAALIIIGIILFILLLLTH